MISRFRGVRSQVAAGASASLMATIDAVDGCSTGQVNAMKAGTAEVLAQIAKVAIGTKRTIEAPQHLSAFGGKSGQRTADYNNNNGGFSGILKVDF